MEIDGLNGQSGKKRNKGKGKALSEEDEEDSEDDEIEDSAGMEEVVVCTLDPQKVCLPFVDKSWSVYREANYYSELSTASRLDYR